MVPPLLNRLRPSRRNQADALVSHGVNDDQEALSRHPYEEESILAVLFAVIDQLDRKRVFEDIARSFEGDAMLCEVRSGLGVIPLIMTVVH